MKGDAPAAPSCPFILCARVESRRGEPDIGDPGIGDPVPGIPTGGNMDEPGDINPIIVGGNIGEPGGGTNPCANDGRPPTPPERSGNGSKSGDAGMPTTLFALTLAFMPVFTPAPVFTLDRAAAAAASCRCVVAADVDGGAAEAAAGAAHGHPGAVGA